MNSFIVNLIRLCLYNIKFIVIYCSTLITLAFAYVYIVDPVYYSSATVKLTSSDATGGLLSGIGLKNIDKLSSTLGLKTSATELDFVIGVGNSRAIQDSIISKFGLMEKYESKFIVDCRKQLTNNTTFKINKDAEFLEIGFKDTDPELAAEVVTSYIELIDNKMRGIDHFETNQFRKIIEKRYRKNVNDLQEAEETMKAFQKRTGVFLPEEQTKALVKISTEIESNKFMLELKDKVNSELYGSSYPGKNEVQIQVNEFEKKLKELTYGQTGDKLFNGIIPFKQSPDLYMEYMRNYREIIIQSKLLEFLYPMYEQAVINENKVQSNLVIIDGSEVPEKRIWPKRIITVLLTGLGGFLSSVLILLAIREVDIIREKFNN